MGHPEGPGGPGTSASELDLRRRDLTATTDKEKIR